MAHHLVYCFQCRCIARVTNYVYNCILADFEADCGSTVADYYFDVFSISLRRQLAAMNCTLKSNSLYVLFMLILLTILLLLNACSATLID